jgi:hypothetical protein
MLDMLDRVELPLPEKVALEDAPLPESEVMLVVPTLLMVNALESPILRDEKASLPVVLAFAIANVFPVPSKFTLAENVLLADPFREMDDEVPPSRFRVWPVVPIVKAVVEFPDRKFTFRATWVGGCGGERLIRAAATGGVLMSIETSEN